jgi:hypothetical protein
VAPIPAGGVPRDTCSVVHFAIRCHPTVPVSVDELEPWLQEQVDHLRAVRPEGTVRLSRLTQSLPSGDLDIGWLLELELPNRESPPVRDRLAELLRDMRLLGLQTTLLAPHDLSEGRDNGGDGAAAALAQVEPTSGAGS